MINRLLAGLLAFGFAGSALAGTSDPGIGALIGFAILLVFAVAGSVLTGFLWAGMGMRAGLVVGALWFAGIPIAFELHTIYQNGQSAKEAEQVKVALNTALKSLCASQASEQVVERASRVREIEYDGPVESPAVKRTLLSESASRLSLRIVTRPATADPLAKAARYLVMVKHWQIKNDLTVGEAFTHQRIAIIDQLSNKEMAFRNTFWSPRIAQACNTKSPNQGLVSIHPETSGESGANFVRSVLAPQEQPDIAEDVLLGPNGIPYLNVHIPRVSVSWKDDDTRSYGESLLKDRLPNRVMYFSQDPTTSKAEDSIVFQVDEKIVQVRQLLSSASAFGKIIAVAFDGRELGLLVHTRLPENALLFRRFDANGRTLQNSLLKLPADSGREWSEFRYSTTPAESSGFGNYKFYVLSRWDSGPNFARLAIHIDNMPKNAAIPEK